MDLNKWFDDEPAEQRTIRMMMCVLDDIQSMMHELTLDERNELMNKHACLSRRVNTII